MPLEVPVSFQKVPYLTVSLLRSTINDTNHCEVIVFSVIVHDPKHDYSQQSL